MDPQKKSMLPSGNLQPFLKFIELLHTLSIPYWLDSGTLQACIVTIVSWNGMMISILESGKNQEFYSCRRKTHSRN